MEKKEDPRREFLINLLSAGVFITGTLVSSLPAWAMGKVPQRLQPGKSIYDLSGNVMVNGQVATEDTYIDVNSTVTTGSDSHVVFVVKQDAFILRSNSQLIVEGNAILSTVRLLSGKLLSVFGRRSESHKLTLKTTTATIGIRGTGVYMESEADKTYVCTCYGEADLYANKDNKSREKVVTKYHDAPRYIYASRSAGKNIEEAPVFNHSDDELALIETLVGRSVPFNTAGYSSPRKTRY